MYKSYKREKVKMPDGHTCRTRFPFRIYSIMPPPSRPLTIAFVHPDLGIGKSRRTPFSIVLTLGIRRCRTSCGRCSGGYEDEGSSRYHVYESP